MTKGRTKRVAERKVKNKISESGKTLTYRKEQGFEAINNRSLRSQQRQ
jgi:hypothetical protein